MAIPPVLRTLLTAPGPSGREATAAAAWREAAGAFAQVTGDVMGSSTARVPGTASGRTV
ncbi:MAG: M42 family peptidase, partial [Actinobacteria bacterium]|nr:M42 family peptidase [Actinomycetota bacterium]